MISVVDDDVAVRDSLTALLESEGLHATPFASASEFFMSAPLSRVGCVVLDVHLPGLDGFQALAALTARTLPIPVVLITGRGDGIMKARAAQAGAFAFVEKPLQAPHLIATVRAALDRRHR